MRFHDHLLFRRQSGLRRHKTREAARQQNNDNNDPVAQLQSDIQTVVNVVYVTASPTFDGPIGGYTTLGPVIPTQDSQQQQQQQQSTSAAPQFTKQQTSSTRQETSSSQQQQQQQTSQAPTSTTQPPSSSPQPQSSSSSFVAITSATALSSSTILSTFVPPSSSTVTDGFAPAANTVPSISSATATPEKSTQSSGMSGGAKAGLAFGILLGIAAIAGLVFFCYRRQKQQKKYKEMDDEKSFARPPSPRDSIRGGAAPSMRSMKAPSIAASMKPSSLRSFRSASSAPRLSLRPVTQFLPDITGRKKGDDDLDNPPPVPGLAMVPPSPTRNLTPPPPGGSPWARGGSPWERRSNHSPSSSLSNPFSDPINPFGDAIRAQSPVPAPLNVRTPSPQDTIPTITTTPAEPSAAEVATAAAVGAVAGATVAGVAASSSKRNYAPKPLNLEQGERSSQSPRKVENPMHSPSSDASGASGSISSGTATAIAAGAGPGQSNVHRVQLDFKPSMDDELELRAGQLVRLLHEYDDGWVSITSSLLPLPNH